MTCGFSVRRIGLTSALTVALMLAAVAGAQADVCASADCGDELGNAPRVQYTFSTFSLCSDCYSDRSLTTAYISAAEHPPNPAYPPNPAKAIAHGKLLVAGDGGAERRFAIGRIYLFGAAYLFDGHLVPGVLHPPNPAISSFTFSGIIIVADRGGPLR